MQGTFIYVRTVTIITSLCIYNKHLGRIQDFTEGGWKLGPPKAAVCRGSGDILPRKILKFKLRRFEAKSWCFEVSFFNTLLRQNIAKLH